jgi:hypothetical protein
VVVKSNLFVVRLRAKGLTRPRGVPAGSAKFIVFGRKLQSVSDQVIPTMCYWSTEEGWLCAT